MPPDACYTAAAPGLTGPTAPTTLQEARVFAGFRAMFYGSSEISRVEAGQSWHHPGDRAPDPRETPMLRVVESVYRDGTAQLALPLLLVVLRQTVVDQRQTRRPADPPSFTAQIALFPR